MKKLIIISIFSLFIFSCDNWSDSNLMGPLSCDEGLIEVDGECVDQCGIVEGNNNNECGSCEEYVYLWGECYNIQETTEISLLDWGSNWGEYLTGSIPSSIGRLVNLTRLEINNRYLSGSIPIEIGNLVNLTHLNISNVTPPFPFGGSYVNNQMSGSIPTEIGELINLTFLNLPDNGLTGEIPSGIVDLTNLTYLNLSNNQLTGEIPIGVVDLTNLTYLDLGNNQLEGSLEPFCELEGVDFRNNKFCPEFPSCLDLNDIGYQECSECETNYSYQQDCLNSNDFNVIQTFINNNYETINFDMDDNENGIIDVLEFGIQVWENGRLIELDCYESYGTPFGGYSFYCGIRSIPIEIGQLEYLEKIDFNQITGQIPQEIYNLINLKYLNLSWSQVGEISSSIGNLINLTWLSLSNSQLIGEIPPEIGNLTNLTTLYLPYNQLTGEVPSEIWNLINLNQLYLNDNQLTGIIPENICDNITSYNLEVTSNQFCPPYPSCLSQWEIDSQDISNCP